MGTEKVRAHIIISGRVQGVFYRVWMKSGANKLKLGGWVRNINDGKVEAVIEGEKQKVEELIERCKKGSKYSKVQHIDVYWGKVTGEIEKFNIVRR